MPVRITRIRAELKRGDFHVQRRSAIHSTTVLVLRSNYYSNQSANKLTKCGIPTLTFRDRINDHLSNASSVFRPMDYFKYPRWEQTDISHDYISTLQATLLCLGPIQWSRDVEQTRFMRLRWSKTGPSCSKEPVVKDIINQALPQLAVVCVSTNWYQDEIQQMGNLSTGNVDILLANKVTNCWLTATFQHPLTY
jgi:hypothetical protein